MTLPQMKRSNSSRMRHSTDASDDEMSANEFGEHEFTSDVSAKINLTRHLNLLSSVNDPELLEVVRESSYSSSGSSTSESSLSSESSSSSSESFPITNDVTRPENFDVCLRGNFVHIGEPWGSVDLLPSFPSRNLCPGFPPKIPDFNDPLAKSSLMVLSGELTYLILDALDRMSLRDARVSGSVQLVHLLTTRIDPTRYKDCLHVIFSSKNRSLWPYLIEPVFGCLPMCLTQIFKCLVDIKCHIPCISWFSMQSCSDDVISKLFNELHVTRQETMRIGISRVLVSLAQKYSHIISLEFINFVRNHFSNILIIPYLLNIYTCIFPKENILLSPLLEFVIASTLSILRKQNRDPNCCKLLTIVATFGKGLDRHANQVLDTIPSSNKDWNTCRKLWSKLRDDTRAGSVPFDLVANEMKSESATSPISTRYTRVRNLTPLNSTRWVANSVETKSESAASPIHEVFQPIHKPVTSSIPDASASSGSAKKTDTTEVMWHFLACNSPYLVWPAMDATTSDRFLSLLVDMLPTQISDPRIIEWIVAAPSACILKNSEISEKLRQHLHVLASLENMSISFDAKYLLSNLMML